MRVFFCCTQTTKKYKTQEKLWRKVLLFSLSPTIYSLQRAHAYISRSQDTAGVENVREAAINSAPSLHYALFSSLIKKSPGPLSFFFFFEFSRKSGWSHTKMFMLNYYCGEEWGWEKGPEALPMFMLIYAFVLSAPDTLSRRAASLRACCYYSAVSRGPPRFGVDGSVGWKF